MSHDQSQLQSDEFILGLLDEMAESCVEDPLKPLAGGSEGEGERRAWVEVLAQLPLAAASVEPPADLKTRIFAEVAGSRDTAQPVVIDRHPPARRAASRWLLPLAAALMIAMVGVTGWQVWRVEQQAVTIARLSAELESSRAAAAELTATREMAREASARLEMMTAASAEFCALRPTVSCPNQQARGTIVMRADEKDWYLRVEGLGPCEKGRQYKLWFVTDSEPILGASFRVEGSHDLVELRATGVPAGVTAVMITLEEPEVEEAPQTPVLLFGNQRMRIL